MAVQEKITYNICMGTGCHEQCVLTTHVSNGRITRTERTYVPGTNQPITGICQKGVIYAKFPYLEHPSRLRYPMKRVGKRGEGKFERISWDQALDEIAEKLNKIKEESGPEAVLVNSFANSLPGAFTALHLALTYRFVHAFGASLLPNPPIDVSAGWASIIDLGTVFPYWGFDLGKLASAKYIILWGNAVGWGRAGYTVGAIMEAKEKGAKVIDIGAHFDGSAAIADEFIPIKPATDYYLASAMVHILFRDHLIDPELLSGETVAPFLVRTDTGKFLRESEVVPGGSSENYVVWNTSPAAPRSVAPHGKMAADVEPDLYARPVVNGIPCATALALIQDSVAPWTPEAQEPLTGVPANVVERITHEYVETEDSLLYLYAGMRYLNAGPAYRAAMMVPILSGKLGKGIGGLLLCMAWNDHPIAFNPAIYFPGDPTEAKGKFPLSLVDAQRSGFPYKALLNVMGNPLQSWPDQQLWSETILPKLDLVVDYDVRMSGTAQWSDYVLPDTCTFERMEIAHSGDHLILCEPAIEPQGEAKAPADFWAELTKRLGIGEHFNKTAEEWLDLLLQSPDPAIAGLTPPLTVERLKKEKMVRLNVPTEPVNVWANTNFPTDSGRIELYSDHLAEVGQAVPAFFPAVIQGPEKKRYPLQLFVGRHRVFVMSMFTEFPELRKIAGEQSFVRMNTTDAEVRGIHAGDVVEVFNDKGKFRCPVRLTEGIPPQMVMAFVAYRDWEGDPPQALMTPLATEDYQDPVTEATRKYCQEHMGFPETLDFDHHTGSGWETLWDNLCDVRKVEGAK